MNIKYLLKVLISSSSRRGHSSERAARIKCLFVLTYETCIRKQTIIYQSVSGGAILGASSHVVV